MPGHIESVPFLSQLEDVDKYLSEYRNLKLMSQANKSLSSVSAPQLHQQIRFQNGIENSNLENEAMDYAKGANRGFYLGNYGNMANKSNNNNNNGNNNNGNKNVNGNNGQVNMNRKKFTNINNNQVYRFNNASNMKYGSQKQQPPTQFNHNQMMPAHFKQAYPQTYYSTASNNSNISLDQLSTSFYGPSQNLPQQQISSGNSSPSLALPKINTPLSGTSSISSFNGSFDPVGSTSSEFTGNFPSTSSPFPNYLGSGMMSSPSISASSGPNSTNGAISGRNDLLANFSSSSLSNDTAATNRPSGLGFDRNMSEQTIVTEQTTSAPLASSIPDVTSNTMESSAGGVTNNASSQFLMSDFSVGWGSNHANVSSSNSNSFGIWNNDMSVWS